MVTWSDAHNEIRARIRAVAAEHGWTLIQGNAPNQRIPTHFYVRFEMLGGPTRQLTVGRRRCFRSDWTVTIEAWERIERGEADLLRALDAFRVALQGTTVNGLRWRVPSEEGLGHTGTHYGLRMSLPVQFDDFDVIDDAGIEPAQE